MSVQALHLLAPAVQRAHDGTHDCPAVQSNTDVDAT